MSQTCRKCGAKCCRYFCFEIDEPKAFDEFENVRWFVAHEGISVHVDEDDDWYIAISNECKFLDDEGLCTMYESRPLICRKYSTDGCDFTGDGDYGYKELFTEPAQVETYARKTLGEKKFEKQRAKALAELEDGEADTPNKDKKKKKRKRRAKA